MMEKEIQRKKKVLIDLTNYGSLTAGFGQIAANYAAAFSSMPVEDLHFGEFYQFNLSSCIRQQNSLTAQFVSFSLSNLANIFYPPPNFYNN